MAPPPRDAFVRRLRALDREALARFVADLHAARGRSAEADGGRVTVRTDRGAVRTLAIATTLPASPPASDVAAVVVGRAVDADVLADGTRIVDAVKLHRMALYAIDRELLSALVERHFGPDAFLGSTRAADAPRRSTAALGLRQFGTALAVVLALAAVVAGFAGHVAWLDGGIGAGTRGEPPAVAASADDAKAPTDSRARSASEVTEANGAVAIGAGGACPAPPTTAHPATLQPEPVAVASDFGLDGWRLQSAMNVTVFRGPNELSIPTTPEVRHEATYASPTGATVVLTVDRWDR